MKKESSYLFTKRTLATAMGVVLTSMTASMIYAQEVADSELEEITVTGSRIQAVSGMATPTPVTAITTDELAVFNPGSTVAEQLDSLPQFFATDTAQRGGNSISTTAGGSYLNLRGMGLQRTLVLINGSRIIPADANGSVNIDNFPNALMQRVDVVTGGASAAYGADAVAGVVNFVLDREFTGLKTRISTGITERRDGENWNVSIAGGKGFMDDRLHLIGSLESRYVDQINADRNRLDSWQEWGLVRNPAWVSLTATPNVPQRITVPNVFTSISSPTGLITTPAGTNGFRYTNYTFTDDGKSIRPYSFGQYMSNSGAGNQNNQSGGVEFPIYQDSVQRGPDGNEVVQRSFFGGAQYEVTEQLRVHAQAIVGRTESNFLGNRSNMMIAGPDYQWTIFRDNPYLPAVLAAEMDRTGLTQINMNKTGILRIPGMLNIYDQRGDRSIGQLESGTIGFEYAFENGWNLAANYQRGKSKVSTGILNVPRIDKFFLAMDAVTDPATGRIVCNITRTNPTAAQLKEFMNGRVLSSPLSVDGVTADSPIGPLNPSECVPINIFGTGQITQEAIDWIEDEEKKHYRVLDQDFAELLLTGEVHEGWGAGPISLATGLTWRDEEFTQVNFPEFGERGMLNAPALGIRGIPNGFAGPGNRSLHPFSAIGVGGGKNDVWEYFGELNVPLMEWSSGQRIGTTLAYRSSEYSITGRMESWKIGLDAQIIDDLRWRFTRSHDIREPNFAEKYLTTTGGGAVQDPLFANATNNSLTSLGAPNPDLSPEEGTTVTTGLVWQPTFAEWIDGLQVSVDWYEIDLTSAIALYGNQRIVDDCFRTGAPSACNLISRNPATNVIQRILNQYVNVGGAQTRGVDLEFQYRLDTNFFGNEAEALTVRALAGYLSENSTTSAAGTVTDAVGSINRPEITATLTANYNVGPIGFLLQTNYFDSTLNNNNTANVTVWQEGRDIDDNTVASQTIFNFGTSYTGELDSGAEWRASFNVTNLFDREPPIIAGGGGQVLSNSHDQYGRRYQLSLNMDF